MAKARFAYINRCTASAAVVTASSEVTTRPASYLKNLARWKKWRSATTAGDQWVKFDLGSLLSVQAFLLVDWKAHASGGTIRVQANDTDVWTAPSLDQLFTLASPNLTKVIAVWLSAAQTRRWVRIYFTNVGAATDYVELGLVFAGMYYQPTYNVVDGFSFERVDPSLVTSAIDGQEFAQSRTPYYKVIGRFEDMPDADKDAFVTLFATVGQRTPFLFGTDPDDPDELIYGRFADRLPTVQRFGDSWSIDCVLQEVR